MFGIQLPQINIPNPFAGVQQTVDNTVTTARNDIAGAGSIVSSDVTSLYNIGRNTETNYVSPIIATGAQGANRIITAGNNLAALPGNAVQGVENTIYSTVQSVNSAPRNIVSGITGGIQQQEQGAVDFITGQEQQIQSAFQSDMQSVDDTINKFFSGAAGVVAPVAGAGADVGKTTVLVVGGIVLVVLFLLFWGMGHGMRGHS